MTALAAAVLAPTLAEALDDALVLALAGAGPSCLWCGSRRVAAGPAAGDAPRAAVVVACRDCGAELVSERSFSPVGRRS
jgi:hypothetical protein